MPQAARTATVVSAAAAMAAAAAAAAAAAVVWFVTLGVRGRGRHFATSARVSGFGCHPGIDAMQRAGSGRGSAGLALFAEVEQHSQKRLTSSQNEF